jgi:hypothetical protein
MKSNVKEIPIPHREMAAPRARFLAARAQHNPGTYS